VVILRGNCFPSWHGDCDLVRSIYAYLRVGPCRRLQRVAIRATFRRLVGTPATLPFTEKWTGWDLNRRLYNRSPISTRLPTRLSVIDRSPVSYFEDKNSQEILLNVEDYAIVPDSKAIIRGAHEPLDKSMGIVREFSDLDEDPAGDCSIELPQLANGRFGPDDLEDHQKPSSSFSC